MDPRTDEHDVIDTDRDEPDVVADESRWLDEGGSNTQFQPADRVPVGERVEPSNPEIVVEPPASDSDGIEPRSV